MAECIVITGASSGIGQAIAERHLRRGGEVFALARRSGPLEELAAQAPGRVRFHACDLSQAAAVDLAVEALRRWHPRVAGAIHCAGDFFARDIAATTPEEFTRLWQVNVLAKFLLTRAMLPDLAPEAGAPPAAIIYTASLAAHHDFPNESAYAPAMHAILGLARTQDAELAPRRIRVAVLSPGLVRTPLTERSFPPGIMRHALPPEAMAGSALYLFDVLRSGGHIPELLHTHSEAAE
jgi:NAD(P)-dependent dehydrogenase (short-subunit alcohol dehydrogenase family)